MDRGLEWDGLLGDTCQLGVSNLSGAEGTQWPEQAFLGTTSSDSVD